jgi:hypothetical protein
MELYKMHLLHPLSSPQAADFPEYRDGSAPKWLLGCTAMAKCEAQRCKDVIRNTPPEIHADIIAMGLYKMHLLHPLSSPQAADFPEYRDGSAPK